MGKAQIADLLSLHDIVSEDTQSQTLTACQRTRSILY